MNRPLSVLLLVLAILSITSYSMCQDCYKEIIVKIDNPLPRHSYYYTFTERNLSLSFGNGRCQKEYIDVIIPTKLEITDARMDIQLPANWESTDLTIMLGTVALEPRNGSSEYVFTDSLKTFKAGEGEYTVLVPFVFESSLEGTVRITRFSLEYRILFDIKELDYVRDPSTGIPEYFFWEAGGGSNPRYDFEIRLENNFHELPFLQPDVNPELLVQEFEITETYYKLEGETFCKLEGTSCSEPGKTYYWGVRVDYSGLGKSKWKTGTCTIKPEKPLAVKDAECDNKAGEIKFWWDRPENAKYYIIWLNGGILEQHLEESSFSIEKTNKEHLKYLNFGGENTLTIWACNDNQMSDPCHKTFTYYMPQDLSPNTEKPEKAETFSFEWKNRGEAEMYEIQLFERDETGKFDLLWETEVDGTDNSCNPWTSENFELRPGEIYKWRIRAIPPERDDLPEPKNAPDWVTELFVYQPVDIVRLTLLSAFGGLVGGFIRIAQQERDRKERKVKIYKDYKIYMDLLVGIIIGIMFYLLVNQTLSQQLNPLNIPPFNYAGSIIIGFLGGLISYDLTRLKRVALPSEYISGMIAEAELEPTEDEHAL